MDEYFKEAYTLLDRFLNKCEVELFVNSLSFDMWETACADGTPCYKAIVGDRTETITFEIIFSLRAKPNGFYVKTIDGSVCYGGRIDDLNYYLTKEDIEDKIAQKISKLKESKEDIEKVLADYGISTKGESV